MPRIAVLEPDSIIALDIAKSIEKENLANVQIFREGEDALGNLMDHGYELFIIDIADNQQSKIDEAIKIHHEADTYCLVISDHTISTSLSKLREAEPLGILVKPFSSHELIANVEAALYRASMEKRLKDSERRYRNLFTYGLSARCVADTDGHISEYNRAFEFSFPATEKLKNIQEMFLKDQEWSKIVGSLQNNQTLQKEIDTRDFGRGPREVLSNFSFFQEESSAISILCEFIDITESKHLREELFQSQKLEALGRLASGVAHDLNNFLTSIMGFLEMVKMEIPEENPAFEDIHGIDKVIQKISALTRQLLGFSRPKSYSPTKTDLREALNDSYKILRRLVPERILFQLSMPDEPVFAMVDASHIEQILLNLVVNARDALEKSENPRISVQLESHNNAVDQSQSYACIAVIDNGSGIESQYLSRIFEPFFTTKELGKGTGLGLSIVKSLTEINGGQISVKSEPGKGTAFHIEIPSLPLSETNQPNSVSPKDLSLDTFDEECSKKLKDKYILIVDDDESILASCKRILETTGANVEVCINAGEAILLAERMKFDILLVDIILPGIYGTELWTRLEKDHTVAAGIFMTGYESLEIDLPPDIPLLYKPFNARTLIETCAKLV